MLPRWILALGCSVAIACLGACQGKIETSHDAAPTGAVATPTDGKAGGTTEAASTPCSTYADKLCEKAGKDTPTCKSIQDVTALIAPEACTTGLQHLDFSLAALDKAGAVCTELLDRLCKDIGEGTDTCKMVREQGKQFPPEQCKEYTEKYKEVLAELQSMEARNKPLTSEQQDALAAGNPPGFGPSDAKVTIVEFSDFQCPYCSRAASVVSQLKTKYGDRARFVFRQFPLSFHQDAHLAAEASLAAHEQGKFWEFHDKLFANQRALGRDSLEEYATAIGLDLKQFKAALDNKTYADEVDAELKLGEGVFVNGTPTMFVNGKRIQNPTDIASVSSEIDAALAQG